MEMKWSYQKINAIFGLTIFKYPMEINFFSLSDKKILPPENHCAHIVLVM